MKAILDFVYTDRITLHVDTVQDLLETARALDVKEVFSACADFMSSHVCESNVLDVYELGRRIHCEKLTEEAHNLLLKLALGYDDFWRSEDSLKMELDLVKLVFSEDKLICESEDQEKSSNLCL